MKDQFEQKAKQWDTVPWKIDLAEEAYQLVKEKIRIAPSWSMFDIGGGTGLFSLKFLQVLNDVTVVDNSESMLSILREKIAAQNRTDVHIVEEELDDTTFPPEHFDLCVSMMTLHHIPDLDTLFRNIYTSLKFNGAVACIDLALEDGDFHPDGVEYVHNGFEKGVLTGIVESAGFTNVCCFESLSVTKPNKRGEVKTYPLYLVTAEKR